MRNSLLTPAALCLIVGLACQPSSAQKDTALNPAESPVGNWSCAIDCPGGKIRFGLLIDVDTRGIKASITNGSELIPVAIKPKSNRSFQLDFEHYDSSISFELTSGKLGGSWKKRRGANEWIKMEFKATLDRESQSRSHESSQQFAGRWAVDFESSDDPAVGIFAANDDGSLSGTFLTTTGDYRFLHGTASGPEMELSCFDGAHAFLFRAKLNGDDRLAGDFWSSNTWHETWTATIDPDAKLPDAFLQTKLIDPKALASAEFPDLNGNLVRLGDPRFAAKAKLIYIFGSWCPNCHDAASYFAQLKSKFGDDLMIVGLAFEVTGDFQRDARQVSRYLKRHEIDYPVLIAGKSADKARASKRVPFIDKVRSYPTTLFVDRRGNVKAIHTGFSGPATGQAYRDLQQKFERLISDMINGDGKAPD